MVRARAAEFRASCNCERMVNAREVSLHWNKKYLQAASLLLQRDFLNLCINHDQMPPRAVAAQMVRARDRGLDVLNPALERARLIQLSRHAGSLDSLRSGIRIWHFFATSMLNYKEHLSAPPRSSEHVLLWLNCFGQHGTALNYLQYLRNFCEIEELSTAWYDNSILSLKKGAAKLTIANGFKYTRKQGTFHRGVDYCTDHSLRSTRKGENFYIHIGLLGIPIAPPLRGVPNDGRR